MTLWQRHVTQKASSTYKRQGCDGYHKVVLSFVHCFQLFNEEFNPVLCPKTKNVFFFCELLHNISKYKVFFANSEIEHSQAEDKTERPLQSLSYCVPPFSVKIGH